MPARLFGYDRDGTTAAKSRSAGPCLDGFGACVSVVVLIAAAAAVFVVRQTIDDHVYSVAAATAPAETTGSR